ncbi:hypothetical protein [Tenacibaculum discolor]|uniref:hypothetical protein n=1 Tax=Tenacibaculum discolor TaxID=361581 RepID=UPI000EB441B2|nr:hypothetical protein [Tenacibaculum discolor]RLK06703.1 hypothetical protein C8N27_0263 [Tenacibaculum discolor]
MKGKNHNILANIEEWFKKKVNIGFTARGGISVFFFLVSIIYWVFVYSYTKSYFKVFGYNYFRENTYESMHVFFIKSIELYSNFIPMTLILFFVFIGLSAIIEYYLYEKDKPFSITRLTIFLLSISVILSVGFFLVVILPLIDLYNVCILLFSNIFVMMIFFILLRKKHIVSLFLTVFVLLIIFFFNGKLFGEFMASDIQTTREKVYLKTKDKVELNFDETLRGENKIKKYLIGQNDKYYFLCTDSIISSDTLKGEIVFKKSFKVSSINQNYISELVFQSSIKEQEIKQN